MLKKNRGCISSCPLFELMCLKNRAQIVMKTKRKQKIPEMFLLIVAIWINSLTIGRTAYGTHLAAQHPIDVEEYDGSPQINVADHMGDDLVEGDDAVVGVGDIRGIENKAMHGFSNKNMNSDEQQHNFFQYDLLNPDDLLDIREETAVNSLPEKDLPKFGELLQNITVPVGREAVLQCVVDNLQTYKIAWLRVDTQTILTIQNHVITKNHRMSITFVEKRAWVLRIRDVKESDKGWYMCQINTDPMKSQVGYLDVVVPPDIIDQTTSADMVVREGSNVTLKCAASGSPTPTITWRREGGELIPTPNGNEVIAYNGSFLPIARVNRLNMGAYLCIASNGIPPTVSKRMMLIVHFPPMISIQNQLVGAAIGLNISLECQSEAHPKSINYWMKNDTIIVPGERFIPEIVENGYRITMRLNIYEIESTDFGSYRCVAKNSLGDTDGTIKLYHIPHSTTMKTIISTISAKISSTINVKLHKDQRYNIKQARTKAKTDIPVPALNNNMFGSATSTLWNAQDYTRPSMITPNREQKLYKKTTKDKETDSIVKYSDSTQGEISASCCICKLSCAILLCIYILITYVQI